MDFSVPVQNAHAHLRRAAPRLRGQICARLCGSLRPTSPSARPWVVRPGLGWRRRPPCRPAPILCYDASSERGLDRQEPRDSSASTTLTCQQSAGTLKEWLSRAGISPCPEVCHFAEAIRRDESAVTTRWSNGPVEGHVNRLKRIKHTMTRWALYHQICGKSLLHAHFQPEGTAVLHAPLLTLSFVVGWDSFFAGRSPFPNRSCRTVSAIRTPLRKRTPPGRTTSSM